MMDLETINYVNNPENDGATRYKAPSVKLAEVRGEAPIARFFQRSKTMRRIKDGKIYDTDTATRICCTGNGLSASDFGFEDSDLYVTRRGGYFVSGRGGAMSRFAFSSGDGYVGSSDVIVLSAGEALAEAERHADADTVEKYFPDMLEEA